MEDKQIVELFWQRDETAITEAQQKYGSYCFTVAMNILANEQDARECVNDTYWHAWDSMPPHRPERLSTFLGKLTRFLCLKRWRAQHTQKRGGGEVALVFEELERCVAGGGNVYEALEAKELAVIINRFLDTLETEQRRVFLCRYWYFDSIASIAAQHGFSESKVKSMLHRTRGKLASTLRKEGFL